MSINRSMANLVDGSGNLADGGGVTVYATKENLPTSGLTSGDQAYVSNTSRLYISNGSGWYNVALINATPTLTIDPTGSITLATDGTPTVITLIATDSDNAVDGLTFSVDSDGSFAGLGTISQDSSVFTITPLSEDSSTTTSSTLTFKASDGISFGSGTSTLSLTFKVANSNYTTFLAKADTAGTDNQVDASTNALTITEYGNTTSSAFSPYHPGGYSVLYDGNSDSLSVSADTSLDLGTGDFTMEAWVYPQETGNNYPSFMSSVTGWSSGASGHRFDNINHSGKFGFYVNGFGGRSGGNPFMHSTNTFTHNNWYHYAITRSGNTFKMYINGVLEDTQTDTGSLNAALGGFRSGGSFDGANGYFAGYVKDIRIVKGSVVYTEAFTPPTSTLDAISNTSLLLCHAPYIADGSTNAHAITVAGTAQTRRFGPYDYIGYTKADHGGSVYFDGTGDYIQTPNGTYMNYGSDNFTFECWLYPLASNGDRYIVSDYTSAGQMAYASFHVLLDDGILKSYIRVGGVNVIGGLNGSTTVQLNVWHHVALVRNGNVFTLYLNGASEASLTQSGSMNVSAEPFTIGRAGNYNGLYTQAYVADARLVKGTAVYTSAFTPPTQPLTAITNTELLTCTNTNDIWDVGQGTRLLKSGSVTASNTQRKFTTSSTMYFDGDDAVEITPGYDDVLYNFGTHDWTVEGWFYFNNLTGGRNLLTMLRAGANAAIPHFYTDGGTVKYYVSAQDKIVTSSVLTLNTWHHIAWVRNGNAHKIYVDGTASGTTWTAAQTYTQGRPTLGDYYASLNNLSGQSNLFVGYMQDIRFTKGLARYTANFTPPTSEFTG